MAATNEGFAFAMASGCHGDSAASNGKKVAADSGSNASEGGLGGYKIQIVWQNIFKFTVLHFFALLGLLLMPFMYWKTIALEVFCYYLSTIVSTAMNYHTKTSSACAPS